jgi:hypothetical protein
MAAPSPDEVAAVVRRWAKRTMLLPVGFADGVKIGRVRESEIRRARIYVAVDRAPWNDDRSLPLGVEDWQRHETLHEPEAGEERSLPAWLLRGAEGEPLTIFEADGPSARTPPDAMTVPEAYRGLVDRAAERLRMIFGAAPRDGRVHQRRVTLERVPVWTVDYEYAGGSYELTVAGQNRVVHATTYPRAWIRISLMALFAFAAIVSVLRVPAPEPVDEPVSMPAAKAAPVVPPRGTIICDKCDGDGWVERGEDEFRCTYCSGKGTLTIVWESCPACRGNGSFPSGSGRDTCPVCRGKGRIQRFR